MTATFQSWGLTYDWSWFIATIVGILLIALPLMLAVAMIIYADRKIWAAMALRRGPNVVGPFGLLQSFADGLKVFLQETIIPSAANKGIFLIPDILCNAGGVTVSYFEWAQDEQHLFWEAQEVYSRLERVMKTAFRDVLKLHEERNVPMRIAANMLGIGRVAEAVRLRGFCP